jgi:bloom syndrome protein
MDHYKLTLKKYFGFDSLRPFQEKIIKHLDKDLLILSPTGSGKSMCFQLPAIASNGVTIIISPLKSLIEDQITQLKQKNINVAFLNEDLNKKEKIELFKKLKHIEDYLLFYVTPEIIMDDKLIIILKDLHKEGKLARMVIDEAHCVSTWGHDFRDSYLKLKLIKKYIPDIKITALTATATPIVKEDIINILELNDPHIEATGFFRSNLNLKIINRNDTILSNLRDLIQNNYLEQCGVIYCHSRRETERVSNYLENYFKVSHYHAGLNQNIRKLIQKKWLTGQIKIIVATIAFGMGIDKPDVRFVIHYNLPSSLEGYYQEIGRAGRDGKPSDCILYYAYQDRVFYDNLFKRNQTPDSSNSNFNYNVSMTNFDNVEFLDVNKTENKEGYINYQINKLNEMVNFIENVIDCRHYQLSNYFGEKVEDKINWCNGYCDNCNRPKTNFEEKNMNQCIHKLLEIINNIKQKDKEQKDKDNIIITKNILIDEYQKDSSNPIYSNLTLNRLILKMIQKDILKEKIVKNNSDIWFEDLYINNNLEKEKEKSSDFNITIFIDNPKYSLSDFIITSTDTNNTNNETENIQQKKIKKKDHTLDYDIGKISFSEELMNDSLQAKYNLTHLPLYNTLINYRNDEAKRLKCAPYRVFTNQTLEEIVKNNPTTEAELKKIIGIGEAKLKDFGKDILKMVKSSI